MGVHEAAPPGHLIELTTGVVDVAAVTHGYPVAGRDGDVHQPVRRRGEVEIDETDGATVADDDVLDTEVVVAHERPRLGGREVRRVPHCAGRRDERPGGAVQLRFELGHADEQLLAGDPVRERGHAHVAIHPRHHLPTALIPAERPWRAVEPDLFEVIEEGVDARRVVAIRTPHGVADSDHLAARSHATGQRHLGLVVRQTARHLALSPNRYS